MAIALTCPSCQSAVTANETERGTTVRCRICFAEVSVPGAVAPKVIPAKAVSAPVVAKSIPVAARPAMAIPIPAVARPALAVPAPTAKKTSGQDDDEKPQPSRRARDDDDAEEDENEYYRDKPKKGSNTILILLTVLGAVFIFGVAATAFVVYRMDKADDEFADAENSPDDTAKSQDDAKDDEFLQNPDRPGLRPSRSNQFSPPNVPGTPTPQPVETPPRIKSDWEKPWKPVPGADGFAALMPEPVAKTSLSPALHDGERILISTHSAVEAGVKYSIQWFDVPDEFLDPDEYVAVIRAKWKIESGTRAATLGTTSANQVVYSNPATQEMETTRATKVGPRIYLFAVAYNSERTTQFAGLDISGKQHQFFDSVQITANPLAKVPLSSKAKPTEPKNPNATVAPPTQTPTTIAPGPIPGATGGIVLLGQIEPFHTGVYLAARKEIWTFDAKATAPNSPGLLRRYSAGSLKLLATVELPEPVAHAAIDEAAGRLYAAVVTKGGGGSDYHERLTATGEFHAYDVKAIVTESASAIKPTAIARPEGKITGLVVSKNGKQLYATTVLQTPASRTKTRLVKYSAPSLAAEKDPIELPEPVAVLRLSPEGKRLITAQAQYNPFGNRVRGFNAPTLVYLIDVVNWKLTGSANLPGVATDLQFVDDLRAIALVPGAGQQTRIIAFDSRGTTNEISPPPPGFRVPGLAFATVIPESERLILSAGAGTGIEVLDLASAKARPVGHVATVPRLLLAGPAIIADPEAKVVVFGSGAVLNVSAAK